MINSLLLCFLRAFAPALQHRASKSESYPIFREFLRNSAERKWQQNSFGYLFLRGQGYGIVFNFF